MTPLLTRTAGRLRACVGMERGGGVVNLGWPLRGRDDELESIEAILRRPAPEGLVLSGGPGVGKSRLLNAAADKARASGHEVATIAATHAAASVPFGAMAHLLPADTPAAPGLDPFRRIADLLLAGRGDSTPVLAVDDAHALDDASAALVHQLGLHRAVVVVATVRTGEPAPDAVVALWKDGPAQRLEVRPLPAATRALPGIWQTRWPGGQRREESVRYRTMPGTQGCSRR